MFTTTILIATILHTTTIFSTPLSSSNLQPTTRGLGWVECSPNLGYSNTNAIQNAINTLNGNPGTPFAVNPGACTPIWRDPGNWACILVCNAVSLFPFIFYSMEKHEIRQLT